MAENKTINVVVEEESTWARVKRMAKKAKNRVLDGIEYAIDNPVKTAKIIGGTTVLVKSVNGLVKSVTGPVREHSDRKRYYDRFNSCRYIDTKRALSSREEQELDYYVRNGGRAVDWLAMKRLLR